MIVIRGTVNGKNYWTAVKDLTEAHDLMAKLTKAYRKVFVWLEDLCGKIILTYERLIDRMRMKAPKKRAIWVTIGVVLGILN